MISGSRFTTPGDPTMSDADARTTTRGPLADLDDWESAHVPDGGKSTFRDYREHVRAGVREVYRQNHANQTLDFVRAKKAEYVPRTKREMGVWEAMELLNTLVDDRDPVTDPP